MRHRPHGPVACDGRAGPCGTFRPVGHAKGGALLNVVRGEKHTAEPNADDKGQARRLLLDFDSPSLAG